MNLKIKLGIFLVPISLLINSCNEELKKDSTELVNISVQNIQAERDFKEVDSLKAYFCDYPEECEHYEKSTYLEKRRFEEKVIKNRMRLAQNFLDSYPNDPHYFEY